MDCIRELSSLQVKIKYMHLDRVNTHPNTHRARVQLSLNGLFPKTKEIKSMEINSLDLESILSLLRSAKLLSTLWA